MSFESDSLKISNSQNLIYLAIYLYSFWFYKELEVANIIF